MRTFIFGIGGTGSRVMRSLAMLLAAGAKGSDAQNPIIPIIIDYDLDNYDTRHTRKILGCYQSIHNAAYAQNATARDDFFCAPVYRLRDLGDGAALIDERADFQLYLDPVDTNKTFADHIQFSHLTSANGLGETADLLRALYDDAPDGDPCAELNLNLNKGFKGCPNIGCVVTKSLTHSLELQSFMGMLNPQQDRVVIVGSIFGGTGASGIPMLLDLIRNTQRTANVPIAVIAVTPYFNVSKDDSSAIDSDTFMAKTKAALDAYALGSGVNKQATFIYYVGDNNKCGEYINSEGGVTQKNPAHVVELMAATMALDFMTANLNTQAAINAQNVKMDALPFEMGMLPLAGVNDVDNQLGFARFYTQTLQPYLYPLARFMMLARFYKDYVLPCKYEKKDVALNNCGLNNAGVKEFKQNLDKMVDYFFEWVKEIQLGVTKRALNLFTDPAVATFDNIFAEIPTTHTSTYVFKTHYVSEDSMREDLNKQWDAMKDRGMSAETFFIEAMSNVCRDAFNDVLTKKSR